MKKWSSSTLRRAAEIQAQVERLKKALAELLQTDGTTAVASNGREHQALPPPVPDPKGKSGGPRRPATAVTNALNDEGAPMSASALLEESLSWGHEFSSSELKKTRLAPIYHLQGLKRADSGRLVARLELLY